MSFVPVDSFGVCLHNREIEDALGPDVPSADQKMALMRRYKYTIGIENSRCDDYVSEKFYEAFLTPTLLLYLGAPNIAQFAPGRNSFVDIQSACPRAHVAC